MSKTNLTGPLTIPMTNDYLFRALLQQNNKVLKGLISSLMHLPFYKIISVEITNPIELGKSINAKDFFLDVKVLLTVIQSSIWKCRLSTNITGRSVH